MEKNLDFYLKLPYAIELLPEPEGSYFIRIKELPGCFSEGETPEEAFRNIEEAKRLWLEVAIEEKHPIPEPVQEESFSGKFVVRIPKSLHRRLVEQAEIDNVSLNQLVNVKLADLASIPGNSLNRDEILPNRIFWPGLNSAMKRALIRAGLEIEAGELEEQIFSNWFTKEFEQVSSAFIDRDFRECIQYLENLTVILRSNIRFSPFFICLVQMLEFQRDILERSRPEKIELTQSIKGSLFNYPETFIIESPYSEKESKQSPDNKDRTISMLKSHRSED